MISVTQVAEDKSTLKTSGNLEQLVDCMKVSCCNNVENTADQGTVDNTTKDGNPDKVGESIDPNISTNTEEANYN